MRRNPIAQVHSLRAKWEQPAGDESQLHVARSIWSGVITFGLVSIPIELQTVIQEKDVHFHQIHKACGSRIRYQKWCPVDNCALKDDEIAKAFEIAKGRYVVMDDEDFDSLPVPSKHSIGVISFIDAAEVDPIYYDQSYYIRPEELGLKSYSLFRRALEERKVNALAKISMRTKESLCIVRPVKSGLLLETLYYPDEIRSVENVSEKNIKVDEREMKMAFSLIDLLIEPFAPENYHDEYREALLARIENKSNSGGVQQPPEVSGSQPDNVINLMDALKASVEAAKKKQKAV